MIPCHRLFALCLVCILPALANAFQASIVPERPRSLEPVYVRISEPFIAFNFRSAKRSMSGNNIVVELNGLSDLGPRTFDVMLGRFPAGHYTVTVFGKLIPGNLAAAFDVADDDLGDPLQADKPSANYGDLWWNPAQPGWGLSIAQGATNELFAVWFVYDDAGRPTWYSLQPGTWTATNSYSGPLYRSFGAIPVGSLSPSLLSVEKIGTVQLTFTDALHGRLDWTIDGVHRSTPIERQVIE